MRPHVPRKLKKKAKKLKAAHDALVMTQSAMIGAMNLAQVALIQSQPTMLDMPPAAFIATKAIKSAQIIQDSAQAITKCLAQIKPWYGHIANYRPRN